MSLILDTGSNIGDKSGSLARAKELLSDEFTFIAESRVYTSLAVEYLNQPDFYNQVLEFEIPNLSPQETLKKINSIEHILGRTRDINKGPRTIDIDIIFWEISSLSDENLQIPHPSWEQRSFVVYPLFELPYFQTIQKHFIIPSTFNNSAKPI